MLNVLSILATIARIVNPDAIIEPWPAVAAFVAAMILALRENVYLAIAALDHDPHGHVPPVHSLNS